MTAAEIAKLEALLEERNGDLIKHFDYIKINERLADALPELLKLARDGERYRWIPVGERLPDYDADYLVCVKPLLEDRLFVELATYEGEHPEFTDGWNVRRVTHWMPLPKAPAAMKEAK